MSARQDRDAALDSIIAEAGRSMLAALPKPGDCTHEFSTAFETKMRRLAARVRFTDVSMRLARSAAAVFLVILAGLGVFLAVDTDARADFFGMVREAYESRVVYRYFGGRTASEELPDMELTWLPDGYVETERGGNNREQYVVYESEDDTLIISYYFISDSTLNVYSFREESYVQKAVIINDIKGDLYMSQAPEESSELLWLDDDAGIAFILSSFSDEADILHIARGIKLAGSTK